MKNLFRANIVIAVCFLATACSQALQVTSSPVPPKPTATTIPLTATPVPSQIATVTIEPAPRPEYVPPTLIPTIDPALLPDILNKSLTIQALDMNGYKVRHITGWDLGFAEWYCGGYYWLDTNHILVYPTSGEKQLGEGGSRFSIASQPVVINVGTGNFWLPSSNQSESPSNCGQLNWSQELKILITTEIHVDTSTVVTYTYDGNKLASYPGELSTISPSRTKILMKDGTVLDLQTNKKINLNWDLENYEAPVPLVSIYWTSDETRIYRCCYFYADLANGKSFRFTESDFLDSQGNPLNYEGLWVYRGKWVLNDKYFLAQWSQIDDGDMRYIPILDPAKKVIYDIRKRAGIPEDFSNNYTLVSPDGNYVWLQGWNESYLVNLTTFESQHFTYSNPYSYTDVDWSSNSKFAWFQIYDPDTKSTEFNILSISDMKLHSLSVVPQAESEHWWHSSDQTVIYPAKDKNALILLNVSTMSIRELSFKDQTLRYKISNLDWNPNGDKLTFITDDHILWQVDYPGIENLEQIIASTNTISGAQWSPDGKSISFISGSDIYIVDTIK